jgi:hypothetical protein
MRPAFLLLLSAVALCAQDQIAVVEGSVVNSVTGAGIDAAKVRLEGSTGSHYETVTDASGSFRMTGVKLGGYLPFVEKHGFFPPPFFGTIVMVRDVGNAVPRLRLELEPAARLRGRVIGPDGKPAAKVEVAVGNQNLATTKTNDDGEFLFENLQAGSYSLLVRANLVRTWYPAALNPALAEPIRVPAGADLSGFEIRLQTARTYRVRGVVLDADGTPLPTTIVAIISGSAGFATPGFLVSGETTRFSLADRSMGVPRDRADVAVTGPGGAFEFPAVPEGEWIFQVGPGNNHHGQAIADVRRDTDDLQVRLQTPFDLDGTVTLSDGSPPPSSGLIMVRLTSLDGMPPVFGQSLKEQGKLHFTDVTPGRYLVRATASLGQYVESLTVGTVDAAHQPLFLNSASPPIHVIVKPGLTITGTVEKGEGSRVLIVPQTLTPGDFGWLSLCGAGGSFKISGLAPGDYYAIALNNVDLRELQSFVGIERLREIVRGATSVRVDEGAVASVQLKAPLTLP